MQTFLLVFLPILFITLSFYITYKKRITQDNIIQFSTRFLALILFFIILSAALLVYPAFFGKFIYPWAFILLMLVILLCVISVVWYKNFYIIYEEDYFIYSNILAKTFKIFYKEIDEFNAKGDTIIIEAKGKAFYIMNHRKYVPHVKEFVELVKQKRNA